MNGTSTTTTLPFWLIILCLLITLVGVADHDLWTPDEPREAAIMLSMSRTGNLLIPDLAGEPFVEKPPLYYIVGAGALRLLGSLLGPTAALRLTSALWGLLTLAATWLLARRLLGRAQAALAVVLLATLPGFIHVSHWLLVDNALLFFVTGALWCLAEAYLGLRLWFLPWAAVFAGAAFLSKGFIGPLIILPGCLALMFSWARQEALPRLVKPASPRLGVASRRRAALWRSTASGAWVGWHGLALLIFLVLMLSWLLALRQVGGPVLWHEWFWTNHMGRFLGQARQLGHQQAPWYYLKIIPVYLLPWLAVIVLSVKNLLVSLGRRQMTPADRVLVAWALGGLLLLSLSATKREIYIAVLLPAFAMIGAEVLKAPLGRLLHNVLWIWVGCMLGGLLVLTISPLLGSQIQQLTGGWGWRQAGAALTALLVGTVFFLTRGTFLQRVLAATACFYIGGMANLFPMLDRGKSYGGAFREMAESIAAVPSARLVGWQLDETTRAGFYYYCDLVFPSLSDINALNSVLARRHEEFNGVLTLERNFPPKADAPMEGPPESAALPPWRVRQEVRMGPRRVVRWIEGAGVAKPPD
ncbi:MAG: glycosyltransferase family 39 protein [Lentisphaerae bacterium]|nr:glycosyltransferase family 39 protein [Lentisphaerota bacterium]